MKKFFIWIGMFVSCIIFLAIFSHLYLSIKPKKIILAVDTSYYMSTNWSQVLDELKKYANLKYSIFCLITEKQLIHSWSKELKFYEIGNMKPYGPQDLSSFLDGTKYIELKEADSIIVITNMKEISIFKNKQKYKIINILN